MLITLYIMRCNWRLERVLVSEVEPRHAQHLPRPMGEDINS